MNALANTPDRTVTAIIVAAGSGERMGGVQKAFQPLLGRAMVAYSLRVMEDSPEIDRIVLVVAADSVAKAKSLVAAMDLCKVAAICAGGDTRRASVHAGLEAAPESAFTLIHDGARPCLTPELVARGAAAQGHGGAAIPAVPAQDTIKEVGQGGRVIRTPDRSTLYAAQTPQVFPTALLRRAHAEAAPDLALDDASLFEALGWPVHIFEGDPANIKVTTPIDLVFAEAVLRRRGVVEPDGSGGGA